MTVTGRLVRTVLALALALVVLTSAGGTGATWAERVEREPGTIRSGGVTLTTGTRTVQLHSRQPVGSRTYASSTSCAADSGFTECRDISGTLSSEALVPGDRVVVVERATLTATGTNLRGDLSVSAGPLTSSAISAFSGSATTSTTITPPTGAPVTSTTHSFPVRRSTGEGIGTFSARTVITTPAANGATGWNTQLWGQRLFAGNHTYAFTQS